LRRDTSFMIPGNMVPGKIRSASSRMPFSGRVDSGFIDQKNWNIIAHRIHPAAFSALQALAVFFQRKRFLAQRANQNIEKVLGNHAGHSTPRAPLCSSLWASAVRHSRNIHTRGSIPLHDVEIFRLKPPLVLFDFDIPNIYILFAFESGSRVLLARGGLGSGCKSRAAAQL
jgi:hypothetical protein